MELGSSPAFRLCDDFDEEDLDEDTDLIGLINLSPSGDAGSSFRTQNDPSAPFQRSNVIERKGALDLRCSCLDVIHGQFSEDGQAFATLIVLQFRFDPRKRARRFESINISLEFAEYSKGDKAPVVDGISPDGRFKLVPTVQQEEVKRSGNVQLGAGQMGVSATGTLGWEKAVARETSDHTTVTGSIDLKGRNWGGANCASWTLLENKTAKTGLPSSMRTAILLKRQDENPFQCVVKVDALVDFRSQMERTFGGKGRDPRDDPVLFDPSMEPTHKLQRYDIENLAACDLHALSDVTVSRELTGVNKVAELNKSM